MTDSTDLHVDAGPDDGAQPPLDGARRAKNGRETHGYNRAERILKEAKGRSNALYNMRTAVGRINAQRRDEYVQYCGGESALTPTLRETIHGAVKARLLLDWVDGYLMRLGENMVHRRRRTLWPVVLQRQQLADSLCKYVAQMEASLAARKNDGENEMAKAWAAAVRSSLDESYSHQRQEEIARELEIRRRQLSQLPTAALEAQAAELDKTAGPLPDYKQRAIQYHLDHPTDSQEAQAVK